MSSGALFSIFERFSTVRNQSSVVIAVDHKFLEKIGHQVKLLIKPKQFCSYHLKVLIQRKVETFSNKKISCETEVMIKQY